MGGKREYKQAIARSGRASALVTPSIAKYNPDQERDSSGKWTSGGDSGDHAAGRDAFDKEHADRASTFGKDVAYYHAQQAMQGFGGTYREGQKTSEEFRAGYKERAAEVHATLEPPKGAGREPGTYKERMPKSAFALDNDTRNAINTALREGGSSKTIPEDAKGWAKGSPSTETAEARIYAADGTRLITANAEFTGHGEMDVQVHGEPDSVSAAVQSYMMMHEDYGDPGLLDLVYGSMEFTR